MCGSWTENVVLRKKILGFIWDIWNVLMMYNYWVWAQSRRSKSYIWIITFRDSIFLIIRERRRKMFRKFIFNARINYFFFVIILKFLFFTNLFADFNKFFKCRLFNENSGKSTKMFLNKETFQKPITK